MSAVDDIAAYLAYLKTGGNRIDQIIFDELPNGEEMNATDELRRLLDGRGVEWEECRVPTLRRELAATFWYDRDGNPCSAVEGADDVPDGMLSVQANLTPEQAVEATLGRGTCSLVREYFGQSGNWYRLVCSECHHIIYDGWQEKPRYCPFCGRRVVDA